MASLLMEKTAILWSESSFGLENQSAVSNLHECAVKIGPTDSRLPELILVVSGA